MRNLKLHLAACLVLSISLSLFTSNGANAIQGGEQAKNHPRIVSLYFQSANPQHKYDGCSAFLYAPRIVVTQAHCLFDYSKNTQLKPSKVFVGSPGKIMDSRGKVFQVKRIFMPSAYKNTRSPLHNAMDIAVMVTKKPVAQVSSAVPITENELTTLVSAGDLVTVGGYGLSSPREREVRASSDYKKPFKFPRKVALPFVQRGVVQAYLTSTFAREEHLPQWLDLAQIDKYAWVRTGPEVGSTCDGDSGSGFFIENGKQTLFVGANGGPMGSPNCYKDGRWYSDGGLNKIIPIFKYSELLTAALAFESRLK